MAFSFRGLDIRHRLPDAERSREFVRAPGGARCLSRFRHPRTVRARPEIIFGHPSENWQTFLKRRTTPHSSQEEDSSCTPSLARAPPSLRLTARSSLINKALQIKRTKFRKRSRRVWTNQAHFVPSSTRWWPSEQNELTHFVIHSHFLLTHFGFCRYSLVGSALLPMFLGSLTTPWRDSHGNRCLEIGVIRSRTIGF